MAKKITQSTQTLEEQVLTPQQEQFCQLYVCGGLQYAGQLAKCYAEIFGTDTEDIRVEALRLTRRPAVMARIRELGADMMSDTESIALKMQISETLKTVMRETAEGIYTDRFGNPISPAPLRAVAVNAAKALMELYPVKHGSETKFKIEGSQNGIIFNVIVPQKPAPDEYAEAEWIEQT
ncbi:hypothetical protein [Alistipes putredinis]|jgi:hypothetical protein|uniref:hypothetical protein n=1 Tax=Alistipes putredinis TaxID=28117 RepID=UPI00189BE50B|nr:hypothetical protein [Rikenellaceae bacterium]DAP23300.1 MAG TPA: terminase small subunit [Caudoviricetes sp.]